MANAWNLNTWETKENHYEFEGKLGLYIVKFCF